MVDYLLFTLDNEGSLNITQLKASHPYFVFA